MQLNLGNFSELMRRRGGIQFSDVKATDFVAPGAVRTVITPEQFGAVGNGTTDDTTALQNMFNAAAAKDIYLNPAKQYKHTAVLTLSANDVRVFGGGTLLATAEQTSEVLVSGARVTFEGITLKMSSTTQRWTEYEKMKLRVTGANFTARGILIDGSAAAGVYVGGATYFRFDNCRVQNTRADGFFISEASAYGVLTGCIADTTGDDGFSVVSYDSAPVHHITNIGARVMNSQARGMSVVGGSDITYTGFTINTTVAAGLYLGTENDTYEDTLRVSVSAGTIINANTDAGTGHGAVLIITDGTHTTSGIDINGVNIRDTPGTAPRVIGIQRWNSAVLTGVMLSSIAISGGPTDYPLDSTGITRRQTTSTPSGSPRTERR